jgi:hypothetical protein
MFRAGHADPLEITSSMSQLYTMGCRDLFMIPDTEANTACQVTDLASLTGEELRTRKAALQQCVLNFQKLMQANTDMATAARDGRVPNEWVHPQIFQGRLGIPYQNRWGSWTRWRVFRLYPSVLGYYPKFNAPRSRQVGSSNARLG